MRKFIVNAKALNIRQAPTVNSPAIGVLSEGTVIDVYQISGDGNWVNFIRTTGSKKEKGWVSRKFIFDLSNDKLILENDLPWTRVAIREIGVREFYSNYDNPRILQYLNSTDNINNYYKSNDETYWCSAFVNWCIETSGYEGTNSAWAKHWLNWGSEIKNPFRGCIVVFKRSTGGHVGFYWKETKASIYVLGGNQDDEVNIKRYSKKNFLGYRTLLSVG